jgi:hypothetical protein
MSDIVKGELIGMASIILGQAIGKFVIYWINRKNRLK